MMLTGKTVEIQILHEKLAKAEKQLRRKEDDQLLGGGSSLLASLKENNNNNNLNSLVEKFDGASAADPELVYKLREENSRLRNEMEDAKSKSSFSRFMRRSHENKSV